MADSNSWQEQCEARQKLLEPLIRRAVDHVRSAVAPHTPKIINSSFDGAIGVNPKHLVIWLTFARDSEKKKAESSGFTKELDQMVRDALRQENYPAPAIALIAVCFASEEEIARGGGVDFFR